MTKVLLCPCCGGNLTRNANACPWCGTEIAFKDDDNTVKIVIQQNEIDERAKVGDTYLVQKKTNYNTESNLDFDSNYHYKFKKKIKKKFRFILVGVVVVVAIVVMILVNKNEL